MECRYYQKPQRKYNDVPAYRVSDMEENFQLEVFSNVIEGALCTYDEENKSRLVDRDAIKIVEMLMDRYHFGDQQVNCDNEVILKGFHYVENAIKKDLPDVDTEILDKILGVIRFVARQRTKFGKEYMDIFHKHVGLRVDTGLRLMRHSKNLQTS
ncbi:MAG: hypothetical protein HQ517_02145 [SAR324 cluster bacterium]|nr:hypothetical protein [SAR324 cluster bacterium]